MSEGLRRRLPGLALFGVVMLCFVFGTVFATGERPNQDEGWYLNAARLVMAGHTPYVDFAYVQPPLLPYVYGLLGGHHTLEAGRAVSLLFGTLTVLLVGLAAWRDGALSGLVAASLLAFCPFALSQQSIVKTYALTNALTALALLLALRVPGRRGLVGASLAFALAALTRNSAAVVLVAWWLWLAVDRERRRDLPLAVAASCAPLVLAYLPLGLMDPAALRYNLVGHHAAQSAGGDLGQVLVAAIVVVRQMTAAAPAMAALIAAGLWLERSTADRGPLDLAALLFGLLAAGHFVSAHPYQEYQVLCLPAGAVLAGLCWGRITARSAERATLLALLTAVVGLVPLLAMGPTLWKLPGLAIPGGIHAPLRKVAAIVRANVPAGQPVLTFQSDVAVEAGRPLTPGLTLASFSFVSSDDEARRLHLMSPGLLRSELESRRPAAVVVSPGDLARIFRARWKEDRLVPAEGLDTDARRLYEPIVEALDTNYRLVGSVDGVGQFGESFWVLARRGEAR